MLSKRFLRLNSTRACLTLRRLRLLRLDELHVQRDVDLIAHYDSASIERGVPVKTEIFAVDARAGGEPDARIAPRVFHGRGRSFDIEYDLASNTVNRKVTVYRQFDFASF